MSHQGRTNSESLLQDLQSQDANRRRLAAEGLAELKVHDGRFISALKIVAESDSNKNVRDAAIKALYELGYQSLQTHPVEEVDRKELTPAGLIGNPIGLIVVILAAVFIIATIGFCILAELCRTGACF